MDEDFSQILNKFQSILKDKNVDLDSILGSSEVSSSDSSTTPSTSSFGVDIKTVMEIKRALEKLNAKNNSRNNLLCSLRPFLREEKKEKLDQYVQMANILSILSVLNNKNDK